jgi:hypothetical protein
MRGPEAAPLAPQGSRQGGVSASIQARIARELGVSEQQVPAAVDLLDGGARALRIPA